ncbi:MAG: alcohol dehydrogenase catalytic domain-containing protein [Myxococcota bacterium]
MRAVRRTEAGIEVVDVPAPLAGEGVRVRVRAVGICQTDVNLARLGPLPQTLGHEFAGELADGTPVGVEPLVPCGACEPCRRGDYQWCERGFAMIAGIGFDGGMADEVVLPARCLVALPRGLEARDACLIEPLAVNLHSLALARFEPAQRVCVVGAGITGFGLLAAAAAKDRGARVDFEPAGDSGGGAMRDAACAAAAALGVGTAPEGAYDLVIEGDGDESSIARAVERCRPGATLLLVAGYYSDKTFPTVPCAMKELHMVWGTLYGHHAAGRAVESAAALLARTPAIARALVTHRMPLDAARDAFALVESDAPSLKVVLEP